MGILNSALANEATFPHTVTLTKYVDPRMIDERIYGHFRYRRQWEDTGYAYVFRFKTEDAAAKFKKDYAACI